MATLQPQLRHFDNKYLRSFYREAEFDWNHDEVKEIERKITRFVQKVSDYIGDEDPLFRNTVIPSGSYFEGLKAVGPDEFDFMICLTELSEPGVCVIKDIDRKVPDPGYVDVQIEDEEVSERWKQYISRRGNLKSGVLLNRFKDLIEKAIMKKKRYLRGYIDDHIVVELRKIPVTVKLIWKGNKYSKYSNYEICLDFPLCIKGPNLWPAVSETSGWKPSRVSSFSKSCWSWFSSRCLNDWRGRETQALLAFIVLRCRGHCFEAHLSKSKLNSQNGTQGSESFTKEARRPSVSLRRSR